MPGSVKNQPPKKYFRDFWTFVKPYRKPLRKVYLLYFFNSVLNLVPAFSIRFYIDTILNGLDTRLMGIAIAGFQPTEQFGRVEASIVFFVTMLGIIIVANAIGVVMWRRGTDAVQRVVYDIKMNIHNHINKLSLGYFQSERTGTVMTKAVSDVEALNQLLGQSFTILYILIQLVLAPVLMLSLSPLLFVIIMIPTPLILYGLYNIRYRLKPLYRLQRENQSEINSQIQEVITGIREVKAFNMEDKSSEKYSSVNWRFVDLQNQIMRVFSFNHQLQYGARDLGIILVAVFGGILILQGSTLVTVGTITAFIALSNYLYNPIAQILSFYNIIQQGMVALERIIDFLNVNPDIQDQPDAEKLPAEDLRGAVSYRSVQFGYTPDQPVLHDISLDVAPGAKVAIVGGTGSGKSTLLSLLLRFYEPQKGSITIDEKDIKHITQTSLRSQIGIVFQDTFLFYGTIAENLRYVKPGVTDEQIVEACKAANIFEDIQRMPDGFDTVVGERGAKLSGGQRQRLAIARVFVKDPAIIILDEATSAVDTVTEELIQQSIERMLQGRTAFIIAHRLSTISACDTIVVLEQGRIVESGAHSQLLQNQGRYYALHQKSLVLR